MTFQSLFPLCSKLPPISASAWCSGDNILLTRCNPTHHRAKQQVHSLPNECPGELTLFSCCLNVVQMLQSLSFSFPDLLSQTITYSAAALNKWLKMTYVSFPDWPVFCHEVTAQCFSGIDLKGFSVVTWLSLGRGS